MVLGMSLPAFTIVHVLISLVGIASGLIVVYGFLTNRSLDRWTGMDLRPLETEKKLLLDRLRLPRLRPR